MKIEKLRSELLKARGTYQKLLLEELERLERNCAVCDLRPAGPYCVDCKWYTG